MFGKFSIFASNWRRKHLPLPKSNDEKYQKSCSIILSNQKSCWVFQHQRPDCQSWKAQRSGFYCSCEFQGAASSSDFAGRCAQCSSDILNILDILNSLCTMLFWHIEITSNCSGSAGVHVEMLRLTCVIQHYKTVASFAKIPAMA